eukprot:TRINITY_DN42832_c0_g1_i1.p1 TRINITY_DN42832_c0_g1~~TRINITY_DN42832_c0_g1_i1.p1  ORF type:complete len:224 (-),score=38.90 TRINITY_DN42832_c0_g1_i1:32-703(-)
MLPARRRCFKTNDELINQLVSDGVIQSKEVEAALRKVDRARYVIKAREEVAYVDAPQPIGHSVTISAPHMHAHALERLSERLQPGSRALDVGSGSGYFTVALAMLLGEQGHCFGIEVIEDHVNFATRNVEADQGVEFNSRVSFRVGDGWKGLPSEGPFDAIHVGAAAATVPMALVDQLAPGGRMIIPVGTQDQELLEVDKASDGQVTCRALMGVRYVPLVKAS